MSWRKFVMFTFFLATILLLQYAQPAAAKKKQKKSKFKLDKNGWCWMTQVSNDGIGHQLHGMLTLMALHGVPADKGKKFGYDNWSVCMGCMHVNLFKCN